MALADRASSTEANPNIRAKAGLQSRTRPSGALMNWPVMSSSTNRRYFSSLSRSAASACFRSVMSCTIGSRYITRPAASRTYRTERWPQTMAPSLRMNRLSSWYWSIAPEASSVASRTSTSTSSG